MTVHGFDRIVHADIAEQQRRALLHKFGIGVIVVCFHISIINPGGNLSAVKMRIV